MESVRKLLIAAVMALLLWGCISSSPGAGGRVTEASDKMPVMTNEPESPLSLERESQPVRGLSTLSFEPEENRFEEVVFLPEEKQPPRESLSLENLMPPMGQESIAPVESVIKLMGEITPPPREIGPGDADYVDPDTIPSIFDEAFIPSGDGGGSSYNSNYPAWDDSQHNNPEVSEENNDNYDYNPPDYDDVQYEDTGVEPQADYTPEESQIQEDSGVDNSVYEESSYYSYSGSGEDYDPAAKVPKPTQKPTPKPTLKPTPKATPSPTPRPTPLLSGNGGALKPDKKEITVKVGETFDIKLFVDTGAQTLAAYGLEISFDSTIIQIDVKSGSHGGASAGDDGFIIAANSNISGKMKISGFDVMGKGPKESLELLDIFYKAVGKGTTIIEISIDQLTDNNYKVVGRPRTVYNTKVVVN